MPKTNAFEGKIPAFYRRKTIDTLMFAHVTALHERHGMKLGAAIDDFLELYGVSEDDYPIESALITYNRIRNNFIWTKISE